MVRPPMARPGRSWLRVVVLAVLLAVVACSSGKKRGPEKPVFPVRGKVFVQDRPAVGAFVLLVPADEPAEATEPRPRGEVGEDGSFTLSTYGTNDGAPAGDYVVTITWPGGVLPDGREEPEDKLHGRYADWTQSALRAKVNVGPTELEPYRLR